MKSFLGKYYSLMPDGCEPVGYYKELYITNVWCSFNINELFFENLQLKVLTLEDKYFKSLHTAPASKFLPKTFISSLIAQEK